MPIPGIRKINTANDHLITTSARGVLVQVPIAGPITDDEAVRAAAWLLICARRHDAQDFARGRFLEVIDAVLNT